ncbi:MAG: polysaccharide deacetylase family protein [Actinomycetota bacterium]
MDRRLARLLPTLATILLVLFAATGLRAGAESPSPEPSPTWNPTAEPTPEPTTSESPSPEPSHTDGVFPTIPFPQPMGTYTEEPFPTPTVEGSSATQSPSPTVLRPKPKPTYPAPLRLKRWEGVDDTKRPLQKYVAGTLVRRGNPNLPRVAITLDDGWNADPRIMELAAGYDLKLTAFVLGGRGVADKNPEFVRGLDAAGWEVCSHGYTHHVLKDKSDDWIRHEYERGREAITAITGKDCMLIRPHGGETPRGLIRVAESEGYRIVLWSSSVADSGSSGISVDKQVSLALHNLGNGSIILAHFGGNHTYEVLRRLIPEIRSRGYEITTVSRMLAAGTYDPTPAPIEPQDRHSLSFPKPMRILRPRTADLPWVGLAAVVVIGIYWGARPRKKGRRA